ncbi:TIGR03905 family TSCPD domain-containing protein [Alloiococcus sp. CFN-8]|uniref:TIGR03905 family TSCPD domain-containing protein n=1 Tax=Alloiococcus sp. CFN-8 TaxID=3416081 RepID=UPI003CE7E2C7
MIYYTNGVCSKEIYIELERDTIKEVEFKAGCPGNLIGISQLVKGMKVQEAIKRLKGIKCGTKNTSCPDQLALALESMK